VQQAGFHPPRSLKESLQRFSLELDCMMVWLRNEARYHDAMNYAVLDNAHLIASLLADSLQEAETLIPELERRITGVDLA
jgi:hypothetical protein